MSLSRRLAVIFSLLVVNAGWIWAFPEADLFYVGSVLLHLGVGAIALAVLWFSKEPVVAKLRCGSKPTHFVLSLCGSLGLVLAVIGATRPNFLVVVLHGFFGFLGAAMVVRWARKHARAYAGPLAGALVLSLALPGYAWLRDHYFPRSADVVVNPTTAPLAMEDEGHGAQGPFFPSASQTTTGKEIPADFFMDSKECGECHVDVYEQWNSSAHHLSSFNNQFYRKSIEYMQEIDGIESTKWCAGCHDHAIFFSGKFAEQPIEEIIDTPEAQAGLGCMSCHSIVHVPDTMGNGGFVIEYPELHSVAASENFLVRTLHDYVTETAPAAHRRAFLKPFMRTAEFCAPCHKVHLDVPVNNYRWLRGFNEYDSWQASGVSGHGARSFYYPPESKSCADCHMPMVPSDDPGNINGKVHSHRFPAANTALAHVQGDQEQLNVTEEFLRADIVSIDIFSASPLERHADAPEMVRRADSGPTAATSFAVGEESGGINAPVVIREVGELAAPLDRAKPVLRPGDSVKLDVVVRTRGVGHFFPGGTVDSVDCWVELRVKDAQGRDLFWSGGLRDGDRGPVESGAHFYRSVMIDEQGNHVNKRNAFQTRSLLYARLIPPGAADVAHYRLDIPEWAEGPLQVEAKLNYRKFSHYYTEFSYAGEPASDDPSLVGEGFDGRPFTFRTEDIPANVSGEIKDRIPDLPVTLLAETTAEIALASDDQQTEWTPVVQSEDAERWNDYGIGLLLQGDLKGAEYAFTRVTEAAPNYADGWLNIGRSLIEEGQTEAARPFVEKALELGPDLARAQYFMALIDKAAGEFDSALVWLRKAAAAYPKDRVVLNEIGRILFLQRKFTEAVEVLDRVARIDPEDLQMHYTRMLCYRGLGDTEAAEREEKLFRRFKADDSAQVKTARIRRSSPEDNNERQPIHEHVSAPLGDD